MLSLILLNSLSIHIPEHNIYQYYSPLRFQQLVSSAALSTNIQRNISNLHHCCGCWMWKVWIGQTFHIKPYWNSITIIGHGPVEMWELGWHKPIHVGNYKQTFAAEYSFWCQPLQRERVFLLRHRLIFTLHKQQKSCGCHMNHITTYELWTGYIKGWLNTRLHAKFPVTANQWPLQYIWD